MNEQRIKELAEQAGFYVADGNIYIPTTSEDITVCQTKFAELIVKECMKHIEEVRQIKAGHPTPDYEQGMNDGMFVAIRTIEEQFGIEE